MTVPNKTPRATADAEPIRAPREPRDHARLVASILADAPKTDDELFRAANDNGPSGAKAHSWPAMRLNAGEGNELNRAVLTLLADLFELAATPHDNVASIAGLYGADGEKALGNLRDEVSANDDDTPGNPGYGIDYCMREGTDLEKLIKAGAFETFTKKLPNGKEGAERCPNFRIVHWWQKTLVNDKLVPIKFTSFAEYKTEREIEGKIEETWHRVAGEEFHTPRGPGVKADNDYEDSPTAATPSGSAGAANVPYVADDPVSARQLLERLRKAIRDESFEVLQRAVVDRWSARLIGESFGQKYNAASALGTTLIRKALQAANDNFCALAEAA